MKRTLTLILAFTLTLVAPVAAHDPPTPTEIQYVLKSFGYTVAVDGRLGTVTRRAVIHYQRANGLLADGIVGPITWATMTAPRAVRLDPPANGLNGQPYAPTGLDNCQEMRFYRVQAGLPAQFDAIGWRESRCTNADNVRTWCCYGYWQNYITSHLSTQSAYRNGIINLCHVTGYTDINSDVPIDKQRQACVTAIVYNISGYTPWAL